MYKWIIKHWIMNLGSYLSAPNVGTVMCVTFFCNHMDLFFISVFVPHIALARIAGFTVVNRGLDALPSDSWEISVAAPQSGMCQHCGISPGGHCWNYCPDTLSSWSSHFKSFEDRVIVNEIYTQIAKFMGPTWDPPGSCRPQMGPILATWTLLSGQILNSKWVAVILRNDREFIRPSKGR